MPRLRHAQSTLAAYLLLAMLVAQWTGLQHRIDHANRAAGIQRLAAVAAGDAVSAHLAHSCTLFDAAALGAAVHNPPLGAPCVPATTVTARHRSAISADHRFASHYSPRAPPLD